MAKTSGFFNSQLDSQGEFDRVYLAEQFAEYFSNFIGNGVFEYHLDKFLVTVSSGFVLNVASGKAFCNGFWFVSDDNELLTIDLPDGTLDRKDNIVVRFNFDNRDVTINVVKGEPGTMPNAPGVVRTGSTFELKIAEIFVGANVSGITQSNILDTRSDSSVCGWVTGILRQIDTSDLFLQYSQAYNDMTAQIQSDRASFLATMQDFQSTFESSANSWMANREAAFDAWFQSIATQLDVEGYLNCFVKVESSTQYDSGTNEDRIVIPKSSLPNTFDLTKKLDFVHIHINGLKVPAGVFATTSIPNNTYYVNIDYTTTAVDMAKLVFKHKDSGGSISRWSVQDQEILLDIGQFKKGVK